MTELVCYPRNRMSRLLYLFTLSIIVLTQKMSFAAEVPRPNGYDFFVRAGEAFVRDSNSVDEVTSTSMKYEPGKIYPIGPKQAWLKENAKALHLLREGLKYPAWQPKVDDNGYFPSYSQFRSLARALVVESHVYAQQGQFDKAASSTLDIVAFGYAVPRGATVIGSLVGNAIVAIGVGALGKIMPHLDAASSQAAAGRLERIYADRMPYFKTMEYEKIHTIEMLKDALKRPDWRKEISDAGNHSIAQAARLLLMTKNDVIDEYTRRMDDQIQNAHLPYSKMQPVPGFEDSPLATFIINVSNVRWDQARADTQCIISMAMLALRAYKLCHQQYPATLQKLVPNYLRKVPIDPFDGMTSLRYRLDGEKYRLWSIGPDGINNNGRPVENKNQTGRGRYHSWASGNSGDIVAGVNVP